VESTANQKVSREPDASPVPEAGAEETINEPSPTGVSSPPKPAEPPLIQQSYGTRPPPVEDVVTDQALRARINQLVEPPNTPWLRHPLITVLLGFVLTGVLGTYLSNRIQQKADESKRLSDLREARRMAARSLFERIATELNRGTALYQAAWLPVQLRRASFAPDESFVKAFGTNTRPIRDKGSQEFKRAQIFAIELWAHEIVDNAAVCASFGESIATQHGQMIADFHFAFDSLEREMDELTAMSQSQELNEWSRVIGLKEKLHGLAINMANALTGETPIPLKPEDLSSGYLATATCKALPEYLKYKK
jgi:hypothetical protein